MELSLSLGKCPFLDSSAEFGLEEVGVRVPGGTMKFIPAIVKVACGPVCSSCQCGVG